MSKKIKQRVTFFLLFLAELLDQHCGEKKEGGGSIIGPGAAARFLFSSSSSSFLYSRSLHYTHRPIRHGQKRFLQLVDLVPPPYIISIGDRSASTLMCAIECCDGEMGSWLGISRMAKSLCYMAHRFNCLLSAPKGRRLVGGRISFLFLTDKSIKTQGTTRQISR